MGKKINVCLKAQYEEKLKLVQQNHEDKMNEIENEMKHLEDENAQLKHLLERSQDSNDKMLGGVGHALMSRISNFLLGSFSTCVQ